RSGPRYPCGARARRARPWGAAVGERHAERTAAAAGPVPGTGPRRPAAREDRRPGSRSPDAARGADGAGGDEERAMTTPARKAAVGDPGDAGPAARERHAPRKRGLRDVIAALGQPKVAVMLALGFSSGLPFFLVGNTLGYWMRDEGIALTAIG